jgi:predicted RNase H-like HicB family nuclease
MLNFLHRFRRYGSRMTTHVFAVQVECDTDGRWTASCPSLRGCATWGATKDEALHNIQEAVEAYVADLVEAGEALPTGIVVLNEAAVSVTV